MGQSSKIPLIITKSSFSIKLTGKTAEALLQQPRPVLWSNDGLYCWISEIKVSNQARVIKDNQIHAQANDLSFSPEFCLVWGDNLVGLVKEMAQAIELMSQEKK